MPDTALPMPAKSPADRARKQRPQVDRLRFDRHEGQQRQKDNKRCLDQRGDVLHRATPARANDVDRGEQNNAEDREELFPRGAKGESRGLGHLTHGDGHRRS